MTYNYEREDFSPNKKLNIYQESKIVKFYKIIITIQTFGIICYYYFYTYFK